MSSALVDICLGRDVAAESTGGDTDSFVDAVRFHRIAPLAHSALRECAPDIAAQLQPDRVRVTLVHLQSCGALVQLNSVLSGIDWLTFKGPALSEFAHPIPGLRSYNDVDVLVAGADLREISRRLSSAGWKVADYRDMLRNPDVPGEMHWISPGGAVIDLHWSMINMASRRRLFQVPTSELLKRRVPVSLGAQQGWTLDPADSLVHACLHAALTGANKLIYLLDVDRLSARITDWNTVIERATKWRAEAQVALVLARARRVLGTELPADLDARLAIPRSVQAFMALADRVAPVPNVRASTGLARFVARAIQPTLPGTIRVLSSHAAKAISEKAIRSSDDREAREGADDASLETYLSAVETASAP